MNIPKKMLSGFSEEQIEKMADLSKELLYAAEDAMYTRATFFYRHFSYDDIGEDISSSYDEFRDKIDALSYFFTLFA